MPKGGRVGALRTIRGWGGDDEMGNIRRVLCSQQGHREGVHDQIGMLKE